AQTRQLMQEELLLIWERTRKTILYVTHNIQEAVYLADRVVVLSRRPGRVLAAVPVELDRPRVEAVLGKPEFAAAVDRIWSLIAGTFPIPKIALLPLLILWLGIGEASKVAVIMLGVFFPMAINTHTGVRTADPLLIRAAVSFGAGRVSLIRKVLLPSALPMIF